MGLIAYFSQSPILMVTTVGATAYFMKNLLVVNSLNHFFKEFEDSRRQELESITKE
jgi:hypothetical protein